MVVLCGPFALLDEMGRNNTLDNGQPIYCPISHLAVWNWSLVLLLTLLPSINNNNINIITLDNVYRRAVIMTDIATVFPVHLCSSAALPTLRPPWAVSSPVGCYRLNPLSPFITQPQKLIPILPSLGG